jgi:hypothetical protein
MFGGYLGGPNRSRPTIELAEAEKTKALLAGVIVAGGLGRAIQHTARNERQIAIAVHGHQDSPELREQLAQMIKSVMD